MNHQIQPRSDDRIDYRSAVLACPTGIVVTDAGLLDNPIIFVNPAFTELTGYAFEDAVGRNCRFLQGTGTDREVVRDIAQAVAEGRPIRREILNYRQDGTEFWSDLAISPTFDGAGRTTSFIGVITDITNRKRSEAMRGEAEARLAGIVKNMPGFVFQRIERPDGTTRTVHSSLGGGGWHPNGPDVLATDLSEDAQFDGRTEDVREVLRALADLTPQTPEFRVRSASGQPAWFRASATSRPLANGDMAWDGVAIDVSREKATEGRLSRIVENMPGYVFQRIQGADGAMSFPYFSPSFARIIGHPDGSISTADDFWQHMHPADVGPAMRSIERSQTELARLVLEFRLLSDKGEARWIRTYSQPQRQSDGSVIWDGVGIDVTIEKEIEIRLAYLAHHDSLTGLANRQFLTENLATAIEATRQHGEPLSLSHLILVGFSEINETLGVTEGDAVLKSVAARMSELAILDRHSVAARLGTAEFAILRHGPDVASSAEEFAGLVVRSLAQPILAGQEAVLIEPCIGTALFAAGALESLSPQAAAAELMKQAAIALSAAARGGPGSHRIYNEELDHRTQHRMLLRHSLRSAIDEDQFELHYQPLVDLRTGRIVSAEALIRWQHPQLGMLRPDLFISLAEESGLIGALGEWVMRRAIREVKAWEARGIKPPKIALNISAVQIRTPGFLDGVRNLLGENDARARWFELELTEGILLERSPEIIATLLELKLLGFELVVDDFGAGHSSFHYLRNFPIDKLKIDQMFVRQLVADSNDALIIRAIGSLAHSLNLGLVAEGIETREQRDFLRDQGCATGQGYFFSLPLTAEDFGWMLERDTVLPVAPPGPAKKPPRARRKGHRP